MKKTWHRFAAPSMALLCALSLPVSAAERRVRVGIYENSPKVFTDESGKPAGIFVDIIAAVAEREGWALDYVPGTCPAGLDRLAAGEIDIMPDVAYSRQRETLYAFHREPVLSDWFQVYTRRGNNIRSLLDLAGKRVAVLERSVQQEAFQQALLGFDVKLTLAQDIPVKRKDGSVFPADVNSATLELDGRPYVIGVFHDMTERRCMEAQLRQAQKLESIGTLASGVAHEINNPINGIMNYARLILDKLGPDHEVAEFATEIGHETERVATIVKNHGGELHVETEQGEWTRFHVDLPVDNGWHSEEAKQETG